MTENEAISKVVTQFTKFNQVGINCVNKGATTLESYKEDVYNWMQDKVPEEYFDVCWANLYNSAWSYDILTPLIDDDGAISDISCHDWDNVWVMTRGVWEECPFHFRDPEHYTRFFNHITSMNGKAMTPRNASDNCTDLVTFENYRLRLNFIHKSINTNGSNIFSIRKIPTHKKTLMDLTKPEEGMLTKEMIPIIEKHVAETTGFLIVGMGGSGKTTFFNALIEMFPSNWKFLFIQENEELYSETHRNSDFLKTVKGVNEYDVSHDLKELGRNGLLMSIKCFCIGEIKGEEAKDLFKVTNTGAIGGGTLHSDSSRHGLDMMTDYIKQGTDYTKEQCLEMLQILNKIYFLDSYRLREITTIKGFDYDTHKLVMETEYYPDH